MINYKELRKRLSGMFDPHAEVYNVCVILDEPSKLVIEVVNLETIKIARFEFLIMDMDGVTNESVIAKLLLKSSDIMDHLQSTNNTILQSFLIGE